VQTENVGQSTVDEALVNRIADAVEARLAATQASLGVPVKQKASGLYQARESWSLPPLSIPRPRLGGRASADISAVDGAIPSDDAQTAFNLPGLPSLPTLPNRRDELRLDVDGLYPQNAASGTQSSGLTQVVHWIANLSAQGTDHWVGAIWFREGATATFRYTSVDIRVSRAPSPSSQTAMVTYSGGGSPSRTTKYQYVSPYFHPIEFEFDAAAGITGVTSIKTGDHPTRPAGLPLEALSLETVYRRAGFDVTKSGGDSIVPLAGAGADAVWSNQEMHDAMQVYWSRFAPKAQWSVWVFFAALHEQGQSLGGIMFDDIGPNQRQGTAIFENAFIAQAPSGDAAPDAWVRRMRFWTAAHEMGHTFNLAHSWQKSLGTTWIPLTDEPSALSYMNYPYRVPPGPQNVFFQGFEYRFSDAELLFMRHAPYRFVQQGNALWFDHHGFQGASAQVDSAFRLDVRVNRPKAQFEFLEPVVVELKLSNVSGEPKLIPENLLQNNDRQTVIIKKEGGMARQYLPFARYCFQERQTVLSPDQPLYDSLFVGAGRNGWDLAEPGNYTIQVALHLDDEDVVSAPLKIRVAPPHGYDEEHLAQDVFTDQVGRVLAFDGSSVLEPANDVLREVTGKLPERRVAVHARIALGNAVAGRRKRLEVGGGLSPAQSLSSLDARIVETRADPAEARKQLAPVLSGEAQLSAETLGHIDYHEYVDRFAEYLAQEGDARTAAEVMDGLIETLEKRGVRANVLEPIKAQRDAYRKRAKPSKK
jgi:hypothetical protein